MDTRFDSVINREARYDWKAAIEAGLIAGAVIWLFSHGLPWFTSGMISPTFVGRDLKPPGAVDPQSSALTVAFLLITSVVYAFAISLIVFRLRALWAIIAGTVVGFGLYLLNQTVFRGLNGIEWTDAELPSLVAHLVFAPILAGLYKGLAARRTLPQPSSPAVNP